MVDDKNIMYRNITNTKVIDFMNQYYMPLSEEMDAFRKEAEADNVPIIQRDAEGLLSMLLRTKMPKRIIEIGTAVGYSATFMAKTLEEAQLVTFEKNPEMIEKAKANFDKYGVSKRITLMEGDAEKLITELPENEYFEFAFIDAAKGHYKDFFDAVVPHMRKGGLIVCDNMLFKARVVSDEYDETKRYKTETKRLREFIDYLYTVKEVDTAFLSVGDGTTISIVK